MKLTAKGEKQLTAKPDKYGQVRVTLSFPHALYLDIGRASKIIFGRENVAQFIRAATQGRSREILEPLEEKEAEKSG